MKVVCCAHEKLVTSADINNTSPYQATPILTCSNADQKIKFKRQKLPFWSAQSQHPQEVDINKYLELA